MDMALINFIRTALCTKANEALIELNRTIDGDKGDTCMKDAAAFYAKCRRMVRAFDEYCGEISD